MRKRYAALLLVSGLLTATPALAQQDAGKGIQEPQSETPEFKISPYDTIGIPWYIYPEDILRGAIDPTTGLTFQPPPEPVIPQIKFQKIPPAGSLQERVARLLEGITVDIPPAYDHYGYELRRYMVSVGNREVYGNADRLAAELKNVKTARIIFDYWMTDLRKKMSQIGKDIEHQNASSDIRTSFKYNTGVINAFQMECQEWLERNRAVLQFLNDEKAVYTYKYPNLTFMDTETLRRFSSLYDRRAKARALINEYPLFSMMVY